MSRIRAGLFGILLFGVAVALGGQLVFPALSSSRTNSGDSFSAGTVSMSDNSAGASVLTLSNAHPGTATSGCIAVSYTGTLDSTVTLYGTTAGSLPPYVTLVVVRGSMTGSFPSCSGFTADTTNYMGLGPGVLYNGLLSAFPATFGTGIADPGATWKDGDQHAYRLTATLNADDAAQGLSAAATFVWRATNK
jgi:hypothetical protein